MTGKNNLVPIHKRDSKNLIKNHRPISLLLIFSKNFERLIFNCLFNYFIRKKLFTECQSDFISGFSCVAQLLLVTHKIYKGFDCNPPYDIRGNFLEISKAFDQVLYMKEWQQGWFYRSKTHSNCSFSSLKLFRKGHVYYAFLINDDKILSSLHNL